MHPVRVARTSGGYRPPVLAAELRVRAAGGNRIRVIHRGRVAPRFSATAALGMGWDSWNRTSTASSKDSRPTVSRCPSQLKVESIQMVPAAGFEPASPEGRLLYRQLSSWSQTCSAPTWWTWRELHPHFRYATPASSCWTTSPWRTPGESHPDLLLFRETRRLPTPDVQVDGCSRWIRTTVSTFRASRPPSRRRSSGGANGCRPRTSCSTGRRADLLHHGTGRLALPKLRRKFQGKNRAKAGRGGVAPPTPDLETGVILVSPTAFASFKRQAPSSKPDPRE